MSRQFFASPRCNSQTVLGKLQTLLLGVCYLLGFMIFPSCQKEKISFVFTEAIPPTTEDLNSLFFVDDSTGYVCGGSRYYKGEIWKTTNSGLIWVNQSNPDMSKALYKIIFPAADTGFACGYDGKIFRTFDGGNQWAYFQSNLYAPLRDIFMLNAQKGICCGGNGFRSGCTLTTLDGGNSWVLDTSQVEYRSIFFLNDSAGVLAGYGAILETGDGGQTWSYTNASQDFFISVYFVSDLTGYRSGLYAGEHVCVKFGYTDFVWVDCHGIFNISD